MATIVGIDAGLTHIDRTSGICQTSSGSDRFCLDHTYADKLSRIAVLSPPSRIDCLGIDAPVLPLGDISYGRRPVEQLFMRGAFQKRCKPGASHVRGTGQALRRAGCETANQFADETVNKGLTLFPRIQKKKNIVEAFPNAFMGVMLESTAIDSKSIPRGEKSDVFYIMCNETGAFAALRDHFGWHDEAYWSALVSSTNHDERAALICAATAIGALYGTYVAVGEPKGGYFFLPPWELWMPWAKAALDLERKQTDLDGVVSVFIDSIEFSSTDPLPR